MNEPAHPVGQRILVDGLMGSGKSTFARALAERTGLPLIHLDVHYWQPGWARPSDEQWRSLQRTLVAGDAWIVDGNDNKSLALRLERAETVVFLNTPWWVCAGRAFVRGIHPSVGEMPEGCVDSVARRVRDEWGGVYRIWRNHRSETAFALSEISTYGAHATVHVLRTRRDAVTFLRTVRR